MTVLDADPHWLTIQQLAEEMGIGVDKIRARIKDKKWPHRREGRMIRFTPEDVQDIKDLLYVPPRRGRQRK